MRNRRYSSSPGKGEMGLAVIVVIALVVGLWALVLAVAAAVLSWGWNLVVPSTFGGPTLDFGSAFALLIVIGIIRAFVFGGGFSVRRT